MQIQATGKLDYATVQALTRLAMFKKADPKKRMIFWTVIYAFLVGIVLLESIVFGPQPLLYMVLGISVAVLLLEYFWFFCLPKLRYNALAHMKDIINEYTFEDDQICAISKGTDYIGDVTIRYALLVKVMETSQYLFIFQNHSQVLPLDKSTVTGGTVEELRSKLSAYLGKKYIICKY